MYEAKTGNPGVAGIEKAEGARRSGQILYE